MQHVATTEQTRPDWLKGDTGDRIAAEGVPALGPLGQWPQSLRNFLGLIGGSAFPMFILWGADRILLYNDAYAPVLGAKHPGALGQPFWSVWPEVRERIGPVVDQAFEGKGSFFENLQVSLSRGGRSGPAWFTFSYSPIGDEDGFVPGVLCVCMETTADVSNAGRLQFLDRLSTEVASLSDPDAIMAATTRMVGEHLGVSICAYADMDDDEDGFTIRGDWSAPGSASIVGRYRLADFGRLAVGNLTAGRPLVINNNLVEIDPQEAATFQAIGISATICMPLVRAGKLRALMAIHHKAPHVWTDGELSFIREVTDRSWAYVERVGTEAALQASEEQLRLATDAAEVGLWDVDPVRDELYWPPRVKAMFGISPDAPVSMSQDFYPCLHPEDRDRVVAAFAAALDPERRALYDVEYRTIGKEDSVVRWVAAKGRGIFTDKGECVRVIGTAVDITARKRAERAAAEQANSLAVLNSTGAALAAELDLQTVVQLVTDAGVRVSGAEFGAFFYNVVSQSGESYMLYTLSGVERGAFEGFPMPRNTAVFAPTFSGDGVIRSDDITKDPRYGSMAPHRGMPKGHLPVRSYLAAPVVSRSGEVIGGLFFGHSKTAMFTAGAEQLVSGIAGQAAIAIDNARLYQAAQDEIAQRRRFEEQQQLLINELNHRVKNSLSTIQSIVSQTSRKGRSVDDVREAIEGRIFALSAAHELLTREKWEGADLSEVVERALSPFGHGDARIRTSGPHVALIPQQALAIAMALHELATNATKYGALSVHDGKVDLNWRRQGRRVRLEWIERGGPPVSPPTTRGFGSRLLERGLAGDLDGKVELFFEPEGVRCIMNALLTALPEEEVGPTRPAV